MKKRWIILCCIFLAGCTSTKSDMFQYENFHDENHVFYDITVKEVQSKIQNKETLTVYFGFAKCPSCNEAMPVLNEVAKENNAEVAYINTRKDASWQSNMDMKDYDVVLELFGQYLQYDDDGKKHLYTPHVFFIKDGDVVYEVEGVNEQLKENYEKGFALEYE